MTGAGDVTGNRTLATVSVHAAAITVVCGGSGGAKVCGYRDQGARRRTLARANLTAS